MVLDDDLKVLSAMNGIDRAPDHAMWIRAGPTGGGDQEIIQALSGPEQARDRNSVRFNRQGTLGWDYRTIGEVSRRLQFTQPSGKIGGQTYLRMLFSGRVNPRQPGGIAQLVEPFRSQ